MGRNIGEEVAELARLYALATGHSEAIMLSLLQDAVRSSPRSVFMYLNELIEKGVIKDKAFEKALTEFYWMHC